ncbi:MAG: sigma-70 family RNA polymerase sigma factor [Planctomycetes bacterium]|nr:sigma-70 family RNA polymerase sigma factor [Planctomycetota bacterium]
MNDVDNEEASAPRERRPDSSHDALVLAARVGDRRALDALWRAHRRWVAAIVLAHAPRSEDLEDLLQEVAATLVAKIGTLRDPAGFRAWLRVIAVNVARAAGRRVQLRQRLAPTSAPVDEVRSEPLGEAELERRDEVRHVLDVVLELSPDLREPLLLKCLHGLSQREIARELDLPETTVETRLARARRTLRERLSTQSRTTDVRHD